MAAGTEFFLLGPLMVRSGGVVVPVPSGKQRALLAALLLAGNRMVPLDELAEVLWGPDPPASARVTMRNYVKRLRMGLGDTGRSMIVTHQDGYQLRLGTGELDVSQFEALVAATRAATGSGSWDSAIARGRAALALWRGEPLADVNSDLLVTREVPRLAELRLQALEACLDGELRLGRPAAAIGELRRLTREHPLRERLHALLMLGLYRDGQQAAALAAYQAARDILIGEVGVEPGSELRTLQQRILTADPALSQGIPAPASSAIMVAAPGGMSAVTGLVPRQLPVGVRHFAGRTAELKVLDGLLTESADGVQPVIAVICGTAGVGKTALAVHWAQRSAERFPDGQLYVNLRGFAPSATLITPSEAIGAFLAALHVPPETLPAGLDARSALLRSLVAGKRVLFVLDNARDAGQVRPLLPGSPGCMVLVTSRSQLTGLVSAAGAELLILDTLPENEARELLADRVGADRVAAEPLAVAELTGLCARLPLALSVVAARASSHPGHPLAVLVAEVRDAGNRLNALSTGDAGTSVRAVLSWSYWNLGESAKRMFRLLGLHPGPDISTAAAAALAGVTPETGAGLLRELTGACLLTEDIPGRFACHDLLKAYAREQAGNNDSDTEQSRALTSVFDYYLMASAAAMDALMPAEQHRRSSPHGICPAAFALSGPAAARGWLDAERPTLLAVIAQAAAHGWPGHVCRMATILFRYLDIGGYHQESATIQALALRAALRTGDRAAQASALLGLGGTDWRLRRYDEADRHLRDALTIFAGLGDQSGQARTLANLGVVESCRGRHERAAELHREALAIFRETGDRLGQARALETLGLALCQQGRQQQASGLQRQALDLYRELGERHGEARMLESIGVTDWALGRHDEAAAHFLAAIAIFDETGDILGQAHALGNLAAEEGWQGRYGKATEYQAAAITLFRQVGDRSGEARVLSARGDVLSVAGQTALAREHWEHALAIYSDLGAPEAALLRARLNDDREAVGVPGGLDVGGPVVGLGMDDG